MRPDQRFQRVKQRFRLIRRDAVLIDDSMHGRADFIARVFFTLTDLLRSGEGDVRIILRIQHAPEGETSWLFEIRQAYGPRCLRSPGWHRDRDEAICQAYGQVSPGFLFRTRKCQFHLFRL